jgi:F-type H+-transporting ATPase subunit epsilon
VSVRNAIGGTDLGKLRESVEKEYVELDDSEKNVRSVMAKMETELIYSIQKINNE